jgi:hypothetical protein
MNAAVLRCHATRTDFWDRAGLPVHNLPEKNVMSAETQTRRPMRK